MKIWQLLNKSKKDTLDILLENRGLTKTSEKKEFFKPLHPSKLTLVSLSISQKEMKKAVNRIKLAKKNKEDVIIYGDYDADGITATAILWEALNKYGVKVMPHIPDRFSEGYGIKAQTVTKMKADNPNLKLIITVDNGIVANKEIKEIQKLGIDVIVSDHHTVGKDKPNALSTIHTTKICGSALAWIIAREFDAPSGLLELAAIGTIADQMPLVGPNRSFAKYGLEDLNTTKRKGLIELIKNAGVKEGNISTYEVNYIIAPRINAMGRLKNGIDSLRLLCTKDTKRANELSRLVAQTNLQRQEIVEKTIAHAQVLAKTSTDKIIFLCDVSYHEGIIGLAAGRLVEEYYRPAIVVAKGKEISKGSARSIVGFNIIEAIRKHEKLLMAHGGHVMAAGFTIETSKLKVFQKKLNTYANKFLTEEVLSRKLKIDCELSFKSINWGLLDKLKNFGPFGTGNPTPVFLSTNVEIVSLKVLGSDKSHLKLKLKSEEKFLDAIGFRLASEFSSLKDGDIIDLAYSIEENVWNGTKNLQLIIKDIKRK